MNLEMFERQKTIFSPSEQEKIFNQKVTIIGVGALGQMVADILVRSGYRHLTLIDGDHFSYSNFNRQLFATEESIGCSKVEISRQELLKIDSSLDIQIFDELFDPKSDLSLIADECILADCTDNTASKLYLEEIARQKNLILVHGAVDGWYGQVASIFPGEKILEQLYNQKKIETTSALMATVSVVAALQVASIIKITIGKTEALHQKLICVDILQNEVQTIPISV